VLDGDRDLFRLVVERESVVVYRAGLRILGQPEAAEDVAQEAFVTAYRSLGNFRGDGSLGGWLTRIATRLAFRRVDQRPSGATKASWRWSDSALGSKEQTATSWDGGSATLGDEFPARHDPAGEPVGCWSSRIGACGCHPRLGSALAILRDVFRPFGTTQ
jgi:DNA-directed RNA polymerase specialized sigma24 family protein